MYRFDITLLALRICSAKVNSQVAATLALVCPLQLLPRAQGFLALSSPPLKYIEAPTSPQGICFSQALNFFKDGGIAQDLG